MAELLANKRGNVPYGSSGGDAQVWPFEWDVVAGANNDTVYLGDLPAFHRLIPELTNVTADGSTGAMNYSLCVASDSNAIIATVAITASTYNRTALTLFQLAQSLGVSGENRKIYLKLHTAPTVAGGKVTAQVGYAPYSG